MAHPPNNRRTLVVPDPTTTSKPHSTTTTTIYNLTRSLSKSANNIKPTHKNEKRMEPQLLQSGYNNNNNKSLVVEAHDDGRKSQNLGSNPRRNTAMEKRGSFCDVRVELSDFLLAHSAKVVSVDMPSLLQIHAVGFSRKVKDSLEKFSAKTLALSLKKEFDGAYGPAWHCIVGSSFGSFVTHSVGGFLYFSLDQKVYILLFKTTVQRAD